MTSDGELFIDCIWIIVVVPVFVAQHAQQNRSTFFGICWHCMCGKRNLAACCCHPSLRRTWHQCDIRRVITRVELKTGWAIVKKVLQTASSDPLLLNGSSSSLNDVENIFEDRLSWANSRSPISTPGNRFLTTINGCFSGVLSLCLHCSQ